jgi:hypothetical protein
MSSGGPSILTDVVAAFAFDLEAGRPSARERAEERLSELRARFGQALKGVATQDSIRAARQLQPLGRALTDFAGKYTEPSFGTITFAVRNDRLEYRWGAVYGPAEIYDAVKGQWRIEIAGSGAIATFAFASAGPARSLDLQGVTFARAP